MRVLRSPTFPGLGLACAMRTVMGLSTLPSVWRLASCYSPPAFTTQKGFPSVSASTTKLAPSGYSHSTRCAPSPISRSTSTCCSAASATRRSRCARSVSSRFTAGPSPSGGTSVSEPSLRGVYPSALPQNSAARRASAAWITTVSIRTIAPVSHAGMTPPRFVPGLVREASCLRSEGGAFGLGPGLLPAVRKKDRGGDQAGRDGCRRRDQQDVLGAEPCGERPAERGTERGREQGQGAASS